MHRRASSMAGAASCGGTTTAIPLPPSRPADRRVTAGKPRGPRDAFLRSLDPRGYTALVLFCFSPCTARRHSMRGRAALGPDQELKTSLAAEKGNGGGEGGGSGRP